MIFTFIFIAFFIALVGFVWWHTAKTVRTHNLPKELPITDEWFSINLVEATEETKYFVHRTTRPLMRMMLHELLRVYLSLATRLRGFLRKHVTRLFNYYAEEHDRLYHKPPAGFLSDKVSGNQTNTEREDI